MRLQLLDELSIPYNIKIGKYKRLTLRMDASGVCQIRIPRGVSNEFLENFISKNIEWIKKHNHLKQQPQRLFINGEKYLYLGKEYDTYYFINKHEGVHLNDNQMIVYTKDDSITRKSKIINEWIKKQAELVFNEMLMITFNTMKEYLSKYPKLSIKRYKSRWGCCYPSRCEIIINLDLIHLPIELISYTFYHELSHFKYLNHSKEYHEFLRKFVPNENKLRTEFKKYHVSYE
ncbi:MAG: DUF45 domain-containing protein [Bacilli bacterium]|nr:DUF45 domain-containing protein [Bacilli bacterium]